MVDRIDIIYTNNEREDIGILNEYRLDLAYGADENSFTLTMPLESRMLTYDSVIYQYGSDVGGIVDGIKVDTEKKQIIYTGRTWYGILSGKVIMPPAGQDYRLLTGTAQEVIDELINLCDLQDLFIAGTDYSPNDYDITNYKVRYGNLYSVLCDMLYEADCKLKFRTVYQNNRLYLELYATPYIDYSQDEEWSSSQRDFIAEQKEITVNHLICLGSGELRNRHVIHLFSDGENIIDYLLTDQPPVKDSDYILDLRNQKIYGKDEVTEILDYPNAQDTENYIELTSEPADYQKNYGNYYTFRDGSYIPIELEDMSYYKQLSSKPLDWETNPGNYYVIQSGEYEPVENIDVDSFVLTTSVPSDWSTRYGTYYVKKGNVFENVEGISRSGYSAVNSNTVKNDWTNSYSNYYTRYWDGTKYVYERVRGVTKYSYAKQTRKPDNWAKGYGSYYKKKSKGTGYETVKAVKKKDKNGKVHDVAPTWKKGKYYTQSSKTVAPKYVQTTTYYIAYNETVAPAWAGNTYYRKITMSQAPSWVANRYYAFVEYFAPPAFGRGVYKKYTDHYADLVASGIERLQQYIDESNAITVALRPTIEYDIGDVVGATDEVTGLSVWRPITKKILNIERNRKTMRYETGGI